MKILSIHDFTNNQEERSTIFHCAKKVMKRFRKMLQAGVRNSTPSRFLFAEVPVVKPLPVRASLKIFKNPLKKTG